mgnify:CR=1 FL=1
MKGNLIAFDTFKGREAAACIVDGQLDDLLIDPPENRIRPGAIYRGKVTRAMKGQGGVIVDTPDGRLFLRQAKGVAAGDTLLVQTTTYAEPGKATPATGKLLLKSRYFLITPGAGGRNISKAIRDETRRVELHDLLSGVSLPSGVGLVVRTAADSVGDEAILEDLGSLGDLAQMILGENPDGPPEKLLDGPSATDLALRDWPAPDTSDLDPGSFDRHGIHDVIEALRSPTVQMPEGSMTVEATRALVAVDVNTGGDTTPAAGLKANIASLRALPRALRLRGLGGQIVVDPAPVPKRERRRLEDVAKAAFRQDSIETSVVGWTPLGHLELVRKRERLPLSEALE